MSDPVRGKVKALRVETPQGESGLLVRESQFVFNYATEDKRREIALGMPLRAASYTGNQLPPILMMNVPEGNLKHAIMRRYGKQFAKLDEMALLSIVGHDQIGRLSLHEPASGITRPGAQVGLRELLSARASDELFSHLLDTYLASGISGVQPKVLMPDADRTADPVDYENLTVRLSDLIVKSSSVEYPELTSNEFLCMDAARRAGIEVPEFHLSDDGSLFVVRRFDRSSTGERLGFEDMTVTAGQPYDDFGNYKYRGSYEAIANLIEVYCGPNAAESKHRLYEYVVLSCMVRNGDAHMKNFGLLYETPNAPSGVRLAPLYDVVTTSIYGQEDAFTGRIETDRTLALKLNKTDQYPDRKAIIEFGYRCNVLRPEAVLDRIGNAMSASLIENRDRVSRDLLSQMQAEWDAGRLTLESSRSRVSLSGLSGKRGYKAALGPQAPAWSVEQRRKAEALPSLQKAATGPLLAFCELASTATERAGAARAVNWRMVEDAAIHRSLVEDQQSADDVWLAISEVSPGCTTPATAAALRERVTAAVKQMAPEMSRIERDRDSDVEP